MNSCSESLGGGCAHTHSLSPGDVFARGISLPGRVGSPNRRCECEGMGVRQLYKTRIDAHLALAHK